MTLKTRRHTKEALLKLLLLSLVAHQPEPGAAQGLDSLRYGLLVPAGSTMAAAWVIPRNPLTDSTLRSSSNAFLVRRGYKLFVQTPREAPALTGNKLSCGNCHLNAGQREKGMPIVGVAAVFPEYNKRAGRIFSLEDRIVGCFMRSENATGKPGAKPDTNSKDVAALAAYIRWLSEGTPGNLPWRGENRIEPGRQIPVDRLDPVKGRALFRNLCSSCHGKDGQGVQIADKKAGPLWGPGSWNDGAGAARVYTLAGIIRYSMPYLNPGSLSDEEAQQIAAYINSMPRPEYPYKALDYRAEKLPADAVYYRTRPQPAKQ